MPSSNSNGVEPTERSPLLQKTTSRELHVAVGIAAPDSAVDAIENDINGNGATTHVNGDVEAASPDDENDGPKPKYSVKLHWLLPAVGIGIFLSAADQTIIVSSYGKIGSDLNALNNTSWIATIYFLTLTSFQPLYGKLSDIFGRKECLLFAYAIFGIGCVFCGLARDITELVAARGFAGIGGGGMTTVVSILMSDIIPLRDRGLWQGYINIIYAVGSSSGAPLGGFLVDVVSWRYAFIIQGPICLIAFVAVYFILEDHDDHDSDWREKLGQIDFLGAFILVISIFCLLFGLDHGSNVSWSSKITIISTVISIPLFGLFVFVEKKIAQHPFAPGHIILEPSLVACYLCNFFAFGAYIAAFFYVPLLFQAVDQLNASQSGARLIPAVIGSVIGSVLAGAIMRRTGKYYWLTISAYSIAFCGEILIILFTGVVLSSSTAITLSLILCSFGGGIGVTTTLIGLIANANPKDQAIATACSYLFRSLGSVVGVSLSATVVQQLLRSQLRARLPSGEETEHIIENVRQNLDYIKELEPAVAQIVRYCYQGATRGAFGLALFLMGGAVISACFVREAKLNR